jgi:hypothetical protein
MKTQLNEELDSIKYLFGYKRGVVISEQKTYYQNNIDKKVHVVDNPNRVPMLTARIIDRDEFLKLGGIDFSDTENLQKNIVKNFKANQQVSQEPQLDQVVLQPQVEPEPLIYRKPEVKPPSTATNIQNKLVELGKNIGPTGADGKIGPNTINAIWDTIKDIQK